MDSEANRADQSGEARPKRGRGRNRQRHVLSSFGGRVFSPHRSIFKRQWVGRIWAQTASLVSRRNPMIVLFIWSAASAVTHCFAKDCMSMALERLSRRVLASMLLFLAYMSVIAPWAVLLLSRAVFERLKKACESYVQRLRIGRRPRCAKSHS